MIHGPVPIGVMVALNFPSASTGMIQRLFPSASVSRKIGDGAFSTNRSVYGSTTSAFATLSVADEFTNFGSLRRFQLYITSSAVSSRPLTGARLWNFTPLRSDTTQV